MTSDSYWTDFVNDYGNNAMAECKPFHVVTGIESLYDKFANDRKWKIKCTRMYVGEYQGGVSERSAWWSGQVNDFDGHLKVYPDRGDENRILYGIHSSFDKRYKDRKFQFGFKRFCMNF